MAAGDTPPTSTVEPDTAQRHTAQEDTAQRDEEATGEEQVANSPRERALELVITIVLSLSALLTAWCAYQSTGLSGEQNRLDSRASVLQLQAFRAEQRATQQAQADLGAFDRWLEASSDGNTARANFTEQRFSAELDTAFRAWLALNPLADPDAPGSPLEMTEYVTPDETASVRLEAEAQRYEAAAEVADGAAGDYVLAVVLLAAGLFLLGIQSRIGVFELRAGMVVVATIIVVGAAVWAFRLPTGAGL
ncbi:MAG: hypothetical protein FJW94_05510 [Actinobacteria bacterium]|nr:hypothetical protein [Actinomycetota bacterium]